MIGAAISPRITPALRTVSPTGTSNHSMIRGFMMVRPIKPQTTDGIAASSSTRTLRNSRTLPEANSAMKMAPPSEKGMATTMARPVTLAVPAIRARMPNSGASSSLGNQ